jgi:hypothetical protein
LQPPRPDTLSVARSIFTIWASVNLDFLIDSSLFSEPFFHVSIGPKIAEQVNRQPLR